MTYNLAWLQDQTANRVVLVEATALVGSTETTFYLSNKLYITKPGDTPSSVAYQPLITGNLQVDENLSLSGTASIAFGDIELFNYSGALDTWLNYVWVNRTVKMYVGDSSWIRADFQLVFDGIIADIDSKSYDKINIKFRDKLEKLNVAISEAKLGGATSNAESLIPLVFGEVCNITPLLSNPVTLEYQVHNGPIERIIEVRDNGVPITSIIPNLANGKFTLTVNPAGTITASIQGDKPSTYYNDISHLIQRIVLDYGVAATNFTAGDLDTTSLATFATANPQPVGIYLSERQNVIEVINNLAASIGAVPTITRAGKLTLLQIAFPPAGTPTSISASDIIVNTLKVTEKLEVTASTKIGYCKNWTIESNLQTGIPEEHKALFSKEYLTVVSTDGTIATNYKLSTEPTERDTYLLTKVDATAEAVRELAIYTTPRFVYSFEGFGTCINLQLGQAITLTYPRFGLDTGKLGIVVGLQVDWLTFKVTVKVLA